MAWTELPENVFEAVMEHLQGDKKISPVFRHVCHAWREAHDRLVTVLRPYGAPPDVRVSKRFEGAKTLDLSQSLSVNDDNVMAWVPYTALTSLKLGIRCGEVSDEGVPL